MQVSVPQGFRLRIQLLPVAGEPTPRLFNLLESDLAVAWNRVTQSRPTKYRNPTFKADGVNWSVYSIVTQEKLAVVSVVPVSKSIKKPCGCGKRR